MLKQVYIIVRADDTFAKGGGSSTLPHMRVYETLKEAKKAIYSFSSYYEDRDSLRIVIYNPGEYVDIDT